MISQTTGIDRHSIGEAGGPTFPVMSFWVVMRNTVRRFLKGPVGASPPNADRDSLLLDACVAIRGGHVDDASDLLSPHAGVLACDPVYLNLLGAVCEMREQWRLAQRFYGAAISVAPGFAPAQRNMRRLYELYTFGRSREPLELGDASLRRDRTLSETLA